MFLWTRRLPIQVFSALQPLRGLCSATVGTRGFPTRYLRNTVPSVALYRRLVSNQPSPVPAAGTTPDADNAKPETLSKSSNAVREPGRDVLAKLTDDQQGDPMNIIASEKWKRVYSFQHIVIFRALLRIKIYQASVVLLTLPITVYFASKEEFQTGPVAWALAGVAGSTALLLWWGYWAERVVGAIYINELGDLVRIAHLTFWGHRKDIVMNTADVAHLSDVGESIDQIYIRITRYTHPKEPLYLIQKYGTVHDEDGFAQIFGSRSPPIHKVTKSRAK